MPRTLIPSCIVTECPAEINEAQTKQNQNARDMAQHWEKQPRDGLQIIWKIHKRASYKYRSPIHVMIANSFLVGENCWSGSTDFLKKCWLGGDAHISKFNKQKY